MIHTVRATATSTHNYMLGQFHTEVIREVKNYLGSTVFELQIEAPREIQPLDLYMYASTWVDKGWGAVVVPSQYELGVQRYALRLRGYVDVLPL